MANASETETPEMGKETPTDPPAQTPEELRAEQANTRAELTRTAEALKRANAEAMKHRLRKEELERAEEERTAAKLTDEERAKRANEERDREAKELKAETARLKDENLRLRVDGLVMDEARKKDFRYDEIVPSLIDRSRIAIDDEDGKISGIDKEVERIAKKYPDLLMAPRGGGSPQSMRTRQGGNGEYAPANRRVDPYEVELEQLGRGGGRM